MLRDLAITEDLREHEPLEVGLEGKDEESLHRKRLAWRHEARSGEETCLNKDTVLTKIRA